MALATVLQIPIHSVYPDANQAIRPLFNTVLQPIRPSKKLLLHTDAMYILWSLNGCLDNREGALYESNHLVPANYHEKAIVKGEKRPHPKSQQKVKQTRGKKLKKDTNQPHFCTFLKRRLKRKTNNHLILMTRAASKKMTQTQKTETTINQQVTKKVKLKQKPTTMRRYIQRTIRSEETTTQKRMKRKT